MNLKNYQQKTTEILTEFFKDAVKNGVRAAFEHNQDAEGYINPYQPLPGLECVPYVCLRLPTGGGKTLIGTLTIEIATNNFLAEDFPFVLWLVPTREIRKQTLKVLRDPKNFYGKILYDAFNGQVNIFDITEFRGLRPQDLSQRLNICVATFDSLKVGNKESRKVYQPCEELSPFFKNIEPQDFFVKDDKERYESFANLIAYRRPLMIVDEAHNYKTKLSLDVTQFLKPSAIIELTATPARNSNVLVKINAEELKKESMIKLPIIVGVVHNSPEKTLDLAAQKRAELESFAAVEDEYIRPIVLYQAENVNKEFNVEYVKNYLIESAKIPAQEIAVATGDNYELNGVDLFSRDCPIRHIITVQALKEGWDCSFASVFCSLTNTHSSTDAEQLLGRVLRMPYAKRRRHPDLNKAYAFLRVDSWINAIQRIKDDLTDLGFEKREIEKEIELPFRRTFKFETEELPKTSGLNLDLQTRFTAEKITTGYSVTLNDVTDNDIDEITELKNIVFPTINDRQNFIKAVGIRQKENFEKSPSERGIKFSIPQLCLNFGNGAIVAEGEDFLPDDWTLTETGDYDLPIESGDTDVDNYVFDVEGDKLRQQFLGNVQGELFTGKTNWTQAQLIGWLSRKIKFESITPADFAGFTRRVFNLLTTNKKFSLEELVRRRFYLKRILEEKIEILIDKARDDTFKSFLSGEKFFCVEKDIEFVFDNEIYPAKIFHSGSEKFVKHHYPEVGFMNKEEIHCAQLIDANTNVVDWIRNIEREPQYSFWLPTHKDKFYPDFVIKLKDGTCAAIEYKGEHLATSDDTKEKSLIGEIWADKSGGLCKFLMAVNLDDKGRNLSAQINEFLKI